MGWHLGDPRPPVTLPSELPEGYRLELVHRYEEPLFSELITEVFFETTGSVRWRELGLEEDADARAFRVKGLAGRPTLRLAVRRGEELVGWSFGFADRPDAFYMASSAVLQRHRRRGLYRAMVEAVLRLTSEVGFHFVHSRHVCTNNPILIAKLSMGFYLRGLELSPDMGMLAALEKPLSEVRERTLLARSGGALMSERLAGLLTESAG